MGKAFKQEFEDFKKLGKLLYSSVSGAVTGVVTVLPVTGFVLQEIVPPWPTGSAIIPIPCSVLTILALFLSFRARSERVTRTWAIVLLLAGVGLTAIYVWTAATFIEIADGKAHVTGWALTEEAKYDANLGRIKSKTTKDLLDYYGHDSEDRVWSHRNWIKWLLLVTFCTSCSLLAGGFSLLMVANVVHEKEVAADSAIQ
jgi:hypothetical protein